MVTTLLGSCRLNSFEDLLECTSIHEGVSYVHSTKEVLQLIKVINGQISFPDEILQFVLRARILKKAPIKIDQKIIDEFNNTELFIIEICSLKKYIYKGIYLHHLSIDSRGGRNFWRDTPSHIFSNTVVEEQTKEEIECDIGEIEGLLSGKKIIFVTHILPNDKLSKRKYLIELLLDVCKKRGLNVISPTECLSKELMSEDLGHYNPEIEQKVLFPYFEKKLIEIGILDASAG